MFVDFDPNDCLADEHKLVLQKLSSTSIKEMLQSLRVHKSAAEIRVMRAAAQAGSEALTLVMQWSRSERRESTFAAKMEFEARLRGASGLAYVPVVAGGDRANIIHYVRNDRIIGDDALVLMDAGAKYAGYCNDITRTWPVSGRFTEPQRELYEAVLRVQTRCLEMLKRRKEFPQMSLNLLHYASVHFFVEELGQLGFQSPKKAVEKLYPHSIGHFLGMDLHDCPLVSYDEKLRPGMVITVEPGLYVPASDAYPTRFHGIGVRIEDDVLITDDGFVNLTQSVPREVEEIEDLMNK